MATYLGSVNLGTGLSQSGGSSYATAALSNSLNNLTIRYTNTSNNYTITSNNFTTLSNNFTSLSNNFTSLSNNYFTLSNTIYDYVSEVSSSNLKTLNYSSNLSYNTSNLLTSNLGNVWYPLDMDFNEYGSYNCNVLLNNATYVTGSGLTFQKINDSYLGSNQYVLPFDGTTYYKIPSISMAKPFQHWLSLWVDASSATNISSSNNPVISCTFDRIGGPPVLGISAYSNNKLAGFANASVNTFSSYNSNIGYGNWNNIILNSWTNGTNWYGTYYVNGTYINQYGSTPSTDIIYIYLGGIKRYNTYGSNLKIRDVRYFDRTFSSNTDINMILTEGPFRTISPNTISEYLPNMTTIQTSNLISDTRNSLNNGFTIDTNNNIMYLSNCPTTYINGSTAPIFYNENLIDCINIDNYKPILYINDKTKTISTDNGNWYIDNINGYIKFNNKNGLTDDGLSIFDTYLASHLPPYISFYKYGAVKKCFVSSNVNILGNCIVSNKLYVNNDTFLNSNLTIYGGLTLSSIGINSNLTVGSYPSTLGGSLAVTGITSLSNKLNVLGTSTFNSNVICNSNVSLLSTLNISGVSALSNKLYVTGTSTFNSNLVVSSYNTTLGGTLNITGVTALSNQLYVTGTSTFNSNLVVSTNNTTLGGTLNITGVSALSNQLYVSGTSTFNSNLVVSTNNTTLGGTLNITGVASLSNQLYVKGTSTFNSNLIVSSSNTTLGGTLNVTGASSFSNTSIFNSNLIVNSKNTSLLGTLNVSGESAFSNDLYISNGNVGINTTSLPNKLNVRGGAYFQSNVSIGTTNGNTSAYKLYVNGDAFFDYTLYAHNIYGYVFLPDDLVTAQYYGLNFLSPNGTSTMGYHMHTNNLSLTNTSVNTLFVVYGQNQSYGAFNGELVLIGSHNGTAGYCLNYKFNILGVNQPYLAVYDNANTLKIDTSLGNLNTDVTITGVTTNMVSGSTPTVFMNVSSTLRTVTVKVSIPSQPGDVSAMLKWSSGGKSTTFSVGNY
jgi:hypothetical protein